ncbi:MAG: small multi-drug export protein [Candidatus Methanofastidiosa archaeon]|nr:small multi-drug export protein [Candidatus Methanofastidiosa archaeon]
MNSLYMLVSFFFIHIGLGRKISIPYAIALGASPYYVMAMAFFLDMIQIPVFVYVYTHTTKIPIIKRFKERIEGRSESLENSGLVKWAKRFGKVGAIMLAAMPFQGGGMWSGVLLTFILKIKGWQMYLLLAIGSLFGCVIMAFGSAAILSLF